MTLDLGKSNFLLEDSGLERILKTSLTRREFLTLSAVGLLSLFYNHKSDKIKGMWSDYTTRNSILKPGEVSHIVVDRQGGLWATQGPYPDIGAYMCHYDGKHWYSFQTNRGQIFSDDVCHISVDPIRDWLWVGGWLGLTIINTITKKSYDAGINLTENITYGPFAYDKEGNVWVATEGGVAEYYGKDNKYDKSKWRFFASQMSYLHDQHGNDSRWSFVRGLICDRAFAIAVDEHGNVWVGTVKGVSRYNRRTKLWTSYTKEDGLIDNLIWDIKPDSNGNIWFISGSYKLVKNYGVSKYDGKRFENYSGKMFGDYIRKVIVDSRGHVWFATRNGVIRYDGKQWVKYTTEQGLASNDVYSIALGKDAVWIGTANGVSKYDGERWISFTPEEGFLGSKVLDIAPNNKTGEVWFATDKGLSKYEPLR